uniref:hypothetical protein n=1 Tax=Sphingomonas sp. TaxID=28214 RepID=UPI002601018C|nr:hypothetical protein [Sphingomonas sp.]
MATLARQRWRNDLPIIWKPAIIIAQIAGSATAAISSGTVSNYYHATPNAGAGTRIAHREIVWLPAGSGTVKPRAVRSVSGSADTSPK